MTISKFRKISILSIASFVGIFILQALWIFDSYQERQAHFTQHIFHILSQSANDFCQLNKHQENTYSAYEERVVIDSILQSQFNQIDEVPNYSFILSDKFDESTTKSGSNTKLFQQPLKCSVDCKTSIYLYVEYDRIYFLQSLIAWIILSSLLIIVGIIAVFLNLTFLSKQKKVSKIQSDFIGNMTHELKTPIATISVASEMLMKDNVLDNREKSKRYSRIIFEENSRLKNLVERVMLIALFENGTMRIQLQEINLHDSINKSMEAISMIVKKQGGTIHGILGASNEIYQVDNTHFSNIITNLLENAIKYSNDKPEISIETKDYDEGILISIIDQGIGIAKINQERIFDRFFRVESGDTQNTSGFGLGLYYVRRVVEAHGGTIQVHSDEGKGSRFDLHFPLL